MPEFDVIIIGAGAAGMMCAMEAGKRGRRVLLMDHSQKLGRKILISGGGRCNFTNINAGPENYLSKNPHFCKSALSRYTPADFIALVKRHKISFHEKKLGQLFCNESAKQIVDMLETECRLSGARFQLGGQVTAVSRQGKFLVDTADGAHCASSLVIATGGLSVPKTGASGFGYDIARQFGLKMIPTRAALDGFTLEERQLREFQDLSGVSMDSLVTCNGAQFRENILITHKGLSGPASLQASLYWSPGSSLTIDILPDVDVDNWLLRSKTASGRSLLKNLLSELLPRRFAETFCRLYLPGGPLSSLPVDALGLIARRIHHWQIVPTGTVGYHKAEVTTGGVDTAELNSQTMECRKFPGLYFIGEVVDVTGWLGGYNFQWAWSSGFAAGQAV